MSIRFHEVEKAYTVYDRPQDRLLEWLLRRPRHRLHKAISGVDFSVASGETFGLVGENGAGKSTLLKIAAGTIRPTHGTVEREGRVAALLELGAGFHPDESGWDNLRFMAALHGLEGEAMEAFVAAAVRFAELPDEALGRAVKTYSSGMFMRLAFAGATAVEPQVLIVDEALSVGDMHFQKKSLDRILGLRERGATVLFCSHNLYQVRSLCQRAIWLHGGRIEAMGATEDVVTAYEAHERSRYIHLRAPAPAPTPAPQSESGAAAAELLPEPEAAPAAASAIPLVKFLRLTLETPHGIDPAQIDTFDEITLDLEFEAYTDTPFHVMFAIVRPDRDNVFGSSTQFRPDAPPLRGIGLHRIRVRFPRLPLLSGQYLWSVYALDDSGIQVLDMAELIQPFTVLNQAQREFGLTWLEHDWLLVQ